MYNMLRALWSPAVIGGQPAELEKKAGPAKKLTPDPHADRHRCVVLAHRRRLLLSPACDEDDALLVYTVPLCYLPVAIS